MCYKLPAFALSIFNNMITIQFAGSNKNLVITFDNKNDSQPRRGGRIQAGGGAQRNPCKNAAGETPCERNIRNEPPAPQGRTEYRQAVERGGTPAKMRAVEIPAKIANNRY